MNTAIYELSNVVGSHATGVNFLRLETAMSEFLPLAVVWYTHQDDPTTERGSRIDLQKRVFLDDFGPVGREAMSDAADAIVSYLRQSRPEKPR